MTDLAKLIDALNFGELLSDDLDMLREIIPIDDWSVFVKAYEGSMDAAIAFNDKLLGARWGFEVRKGFAKVLHLKSWEKDIPVFNSVTSRALLIVTLKAYEWEKEQYMEKEQ